MFYIYHSISLILLILQTTHTLQNEPENPQQIQSPLLEVFMHLPPNFPNIRSFQNTLNPQPPRLKRNTRERTLVDVRSYELTQPVVTREVKTTSKPTRTRRDTEPKPEPEKLLQSQPLPTPDAIRSQIYKSYPVKEFDIVDIDEPDDSRRRKESIDRPDDNSQRDKRTFLEEGSGETTTPIPFWKRKKENPPFVTGRGGSVTSGSNYPPAQHRSSDTARESHSLKNLDKTLQSNEITRSNQDNYYSATNRRTYSRQYDSPPSSTPKSVYDTIDYNQKRNQDFNRNQEPERHQVDKKETFRDGRPTHEQYRQYPYPWMYERPYYQPAFPYPTEVLGRGVEYYHRTYDPTTGRIIYYANMPDQGRTYDYRYMDPISRNFYVNRPYYDPYYRSYVPPFDYRFANGRSMDYLRNGRSSSQSYSYPFQEREKYPRDARLTGGFETGNRLKEEFRNKTYIIYDADESRSQFTRPENRPGYTPQAPPPPLNNNPQGQQVPFRQFAFPPVDYSLPPQVFPFRNQYYLSSPGPNWGFSHRSTSGLTEQRPVNSREVQLPLTITRDNREMEKPKKS